MTAAPPKKTVLVVDDEKESRNFMGELLAHAGYEVMFANNGAEAVGIAERWKIELIELDLIMPVMDGITVVRKLKSDIMSARVPILAVTGDHGSMLREEAMAAGCDTYILKPIDPVAFISLVRHWVER